MTVKTGQAISGSFATVDGTGALTAATGTPVGTLYVAGDANGAAVTITGANPYKFAVTLPTLTAGQLCQMYITATVDAVATGWFVWADVADADMIADGVWDEALAGHTTAGTAGDAMGQIATGSITVVSPVDTEGDITIDRGYDYYADDGRELSWTDAEAVTWPDLTGATATFYVGDYLEVEGVITDPTGPATITVELSADDTEDLPLGVRPFKIDVELANEHLILQVRGNITVRG